MFHLADMPRCACALLTLLAALSLSCGSGPGTPNPGPSATPQAGGPVVGRYLAQVTPGPGCAMARSPLGVTVEAQPAGTAPYPGVQALVLGDGSRFELEFLSEQVRLRGGAGTTEEGVLTNEGLRLWVHGIAAGLVFRSADGRGQITSGTLTGYVALGPADGEEGAMGTCTATDHAFTLRAQ